MFQRKPESLFRKSVMAKDFLNDIGTEFEAKPIPSTLEHSHDGESSKSIRCKKLKLSQSGDEVMKKITETTEGSMTQHQSPHLDSNVFELAPYTMPLDPDKSESPPKTPPQIEQSGTESMSGYTAL